MSSARVPPNSYEAERAVLGGLMLDNEAWERVAEIVSEGDFHHREHRILFRTIGELAESGQPRDVVTVSEWLTEHGELNNLGDLASLGELVEQTPSAANIAAYANIVLKRSRERQLLKVTESMASELYESSGHDIDALVAQVEHSLTAIAEQSSASRQGPKPIHDLAGGALEQIKARAASDSDITGVETGYSELDAMTSGLQRQDLVIGAARPGQGKTTFCMNIAEHVALTNGQPVAVFSMEMPEEQIATRMIASLGRVELQKLRSGRLEESDWSRVDSAVAQMSQQSKLFIDDTSGLTPSELRIRARRIQRQHGLAMIVVDYIQLMECDRGSDNRTADITQISHELKSIAKDLDVPVVVLSQLNRALEQRTDKRPIMSDLRESGAIEQDADVIAFIYRDEVYNENSADKGTAELLIRKQRNGPTGMTRLTFQGQYMRFENGPPATSCNGVDTPAPPQHASYGNPANERLSPEEFFGDGN